MENERKPFTAPVHMNNACDQLIAGVPRERAVTPLAIRSAEAHWPSNALQLQCWNGHHPDREECGSPGSQNHPIYAAYVLGFYDWLVAVARVWLTEGVFGIELGAPGSYYCAKVLQTLLAAERDLRRMGRHEDAEVIRLAVRAALAHDCMTTYPATRLHDTRIYGAPVKGRLKGKGQTLTSQIAANKVRRRDTTAVVGMRYTSQERGGDGGRLAEDSHSEIFAAERGTVDGCGLNSHEINAMNRAIGGDVGAAREVASWMVGVIETPTRVWEIVQERYDVGAQSINKCQRPHHYKHAMSVAQIWANGDYKMMQAMPRGSTLSKWGPDEYKVAEEGGIITATCRTGIGSIPAMTGKLLWRCIARGRRVYFNDELVAERAA